MHIKGLHLKQNKYQNNMLETNKQKDQYAFKYQVWVHHDVWNHDTSWAAMLEN